MRTAGYMMKKDLFICESGLDINLLNLLCLDLLEEEEKMGRHNEMTDLMRKYPGRGTP